MNVNTVTVFTELVFLALIVIALVYTIYRDTTKMVNNFKIQITAAQTAKKPDIDKLPYSDLMKIVNENINYHTSQNMTVLGLASKSGDEISITIDTMTADISTKVRTSISSMVTECILCYVTEEFFNRYIFNSVRLMIVANVEKQKIELMRAQLNNKADKKQTNKK